MNRIFSAVRNYLFHPTDIRISIFNIMATVGGSVSLLAFIVSVFNGVTVWNLAALLCCILISVSLLVYSQKTGHYRICYLLTIITVFVIMFPVIFFTAGGLNSGMPIYFVFAVSYTVFMLENKSGLMIAAAQIVEYVVCCFVAMRFPQTVIPFASKQAEAMDIISCIIVCSVAMSATVYWQTRLYHKQQKKTEDALDEVKRQSQAKDVFLANMSHEIRTPINLILGMSEMIDRTATDDMVLGFNEKIRVFGKTLLTMIRNVLDITKIQTGQTELEANAYRLEDIVAELEMLGGELVSKKQLSFSVKRDYADALTLIGDKEHFMQILSNLVTNAIKYTEQGSVRLTVQAKPNDSGSCQLTVRVEDTGIGIPESELPHIFEIFYRAEKSRSVEGTGIGLAIVKELTDRMGGKIAVETMDGVGTAFTVTLTQAVSGQTAEKRERTVMHYIAPDCRVLAVDDNPENLQLLKTLLGRTMLQIDTAGSGIEGIRLAVSKPYDIIILDYMMPEMDGIETLSRMKQKGIEAAFIALTADAVAGTGAKMTEAGFDEYVTKPVDWMKFEQVLLRYIPKKKVAFESSQSAALTAEQIAGFTAQIENCELDIAYGLRRVDQNTAIYRKILLLFCSHFSQNAVKAAELLAKSDWQGLCTVMHSLKAQARGIGGSLLANMAETMEHKLRQGDDVYAESAFSLLQLQWERTQAQAAQLAKLLPESEEESASDTVSSLEEQAIHALQNNLWLNAREAVEALQKQDGQNPVYGEMLELIEKFAFKDALELLQNGVN